MDNGKLFHLIFFVYQCDFVVLFFRITRNVRICRSQTKARERSKNAKNFRQTVAIQKNNYSTLITKNVASACWRNRLWRGHFSQAKLRWKSNRNISENQRSLLLDVSQIYILAVLPASDIASASQLNVNHYFWRRKRDFSHINLANNHYFLFVIAVVWILASDCLDRLTRKTWTPTNTDNRITPIRQLEHEMLI